MELQERKLDCFQDLSNYYNHIIFDQGVKEVLPASNGIDEDYSMSDLDFDSSSDSGDNNSASTSQYSFKRPPITQFSFTSIIREMEQVR